MDATNFELTTIQENAFIYETHLRNVNRRRELWSKQTRDKIISTLETVIKNFKKIDWSVVINSTRQNYETVALKIADSPSGIKEVDAKGNELHAFTKCGASLGFSQLISGKIKVWFDYPCVEGIQEQPEEQKKLVIIEPSYVNESLIAGYVQQFLHEITSFESNI